MRLSLETEWTTIPYQLLSRASMRSSHHVREGAVQILTRTHTQTHKHAGTCLHVQRNLPTKHTIPHAHSRSCYFPLFGQIVYGTVGDIIDILSIITTVFAVCASMGVGAIQVAREHATNAESYQSKWQQETAWKSAERDA